MNERGAAPRVELLWWAGCPSWERALAELREEAAAVGIGAEEIAVREVRSDEEAEREGFPGSPTICIDGRDVQPPGDEPIGLACRVYRLRDGRTSPLPDRVDVREALVEAGGRSAETEAKTGSASDRGG